MVKKRRRRSAIRGKPGIIGFVLFLLLAFAVSIVVRRTVFVVKQINVAGNTSIQSSQIIERSGIEIGESVFGITEDRLRLAFDGLGKLSFEGFDINMPSTVNIYVRERVPRVRISYAGLPTVLDEYGYAMAQASNMNNVNLPVVSGLNLKSCQVGKLVKSEVQGQVEAMCEVVTQLYAQQFQSIFSELNVADLDNLYLMARSGMMVKLGDSTEMQNKLLWVNGALTQLTAEGVISGIVDVSSAKDAIYRPTQVSEGA